MIDIYYNKYFLADAESAFNSVIVLLLTAAFFEHKPFCTPTLINLSIEIILGNGVKVYGDKYVVILLAQLVAKYSSIGKS